ncbi:TetR/AcrR family transcriptional regulator [Streptococcus agalactiae]|uniref:TetR/AcrR family transcriptional regulator n=1 Tax=Streptococcus agalactiae TaxID=1311 RepID=UPI0039ECE365
MTVSDLAKKAQLSRRAFYNHFNSKEDFLRESILIIFDDITKILNNDLLYEEVILKEMLSYMYTNKEIIKSFVCFFPNIDNIIKDYTFRYTRLRETTRNSISNSIFFRS